MADKLALLQSLVTATDRAAIDAVRAVKTAINTRHHNKR